jgi:hypothetical protein
MFRSKPIAFTWDQNCKFLSTNGKLKFHASSAHCNMVQVAQLQGTICADIAQQDATSRGTEAHTQILDSQKVCRWLPRWINGNAIKWQWQWQWTHFKICCILLLSLLLVAVMVIVVVVCSVLCAFLNLQCNRHYYSCQALYEPVEFNDDDYDGIITTIISNNVPPLLIFSLRTGQNVALCKQGSYNKHL